MDEFDVTDLRLEQEDKIRKENRAKQLANKLITEECEGCGISIPDARQKATGGTNHCVDCQYKLELKYKLTRG